MRAPGISPLEIYVNKLDRRMLLPADVRADFLALPMSTFVAEPQAVVAEEGQDARTCFFVLSGFLTRQKQANGSRKIIGVGIPGDAVDLQSLWFEKQDHSLVAHRGTTIVSVAHADLARLCDRHSSLGRALWHDTLVDAAIFREWTLNIAHRRARLRIAHLFLETATRFKAHDLIDGDTFELPLTQSELASALGLSLVHYNKSLRALRDQGLVEVESRTITLIDRSALERATAFDPSYLHIKTAPKAGFSSRSEE